MKISPVSGPGVIPVNGTPESIRTAKAVAAFQKGQSTYDKPAPTQGQAQETPVQNPNQISVEELSAIQAQPEPTEIIDNNASIEEPAEEVPPAPKEDPALSRQFAQLARQEKALRAKAQQQAIEYKQRMEALEAREQALGQKPQFDPKEYISRSRLKQEALNVLAEEGIELDPLYQQHISRTPVDPQVQATIKALEAKIARLEETNENSAKTHQEQQAQQYQAAVKQITLDAKNLVQSDPEAYEAISKTGTVKQVVKLIEDTYAKDGILMSVEEAANEVENYLVEENVNMANSIGKIKKRLEAAKASQLKTETKTQEPRQTQPAMKTLTNAASSTRQLSAKERAILAFKGELKS